MKISDLVLSIGVSQYVVGTAHVFRNGVQYFSPIPGIAKVDCSPHGHAHGRTEALWGASKENWRQE